MTSEDETEHLLVSLNAPMFGAEISGALVVIETVHSLGSSRSTGPKED